MGDQTDILVRVRTIADKKVLFLPHALRQMLRPERMISTSEVRQVVVKGEVIEDYPEDPRGRSCLILGSGDENRPIHVVCAPKEEFLAIITAYIPDPAEWSGDLKKRIEK
jgi:hypothetical protein